MKQFDLFSSPSPSQGIPQQIETSHDHPQGIPQQIETSATTLEAARAKLRSELGTGAICPCCEQHAKIYKRSLNSSMAYVLILLSKLPPDRYIHVTEHLNASTKLSPRAKAALRGDFTKLRYWRFLKAEPRARDDGSRRTGYWRATAAGRAFARGATRARKYVYEYNGGQVEPDDADETTITIRDALGDRFNYSDLMSASVETGGLFT